MLVETYSLHELITKQPVQTKKLKNQMEKSTKFKSSSHFIILSFGINFIFI